MTEDHSNHRRVVADDGECSASAPFQRQQSIERVLKLLLDREEVKLKVSHKQLRCESK